MELNTYLGILWRRKSIILITTLFTLTIITVGTFFATPIYTATTKLRIVTTASTPVFTFNYDILYADRIMETYISIANSAPVLNEVGRRLNLPEAPEIKVTILPNTELVTIVADNENPMLAANIVNTLASLLIEQSRELYTGNRKSAQEILGEQLVQMEGELNQARFEYDTVASRFPPNPEQLQIANQALEIKQNAYSRVLEQYEQSRLREQLQENALSIVEPATVPEDPSKPNKPMNIVLGLMIGLIGGVALAFLFENVDSTLRTAAQIESTTQLPVLGKIPQFKQDHSLAFMKGSTQEKEAIRRLRSQVMNYHNERALKTLLIVSAEPGEGKSTMTANLALSLAKIGQKTIVVDSDLHLPALHKLFELPNQVGLSNYLAEETTFEESLQNTNIFGLQIMTSGPLPPNSSELLGSQRTWALHEQLQQSCDVALIDTSAMLAISDATVLAPIVDGVVLVVSCNQARQETVKAVRQQLDDVNANLIGVVVNRADLDNSYQFYYPEE